MADLRDMLRDAEDAAIARFRIDIEACIKRMRAALAELIEKAAGDLTEGERAKAAILAETEAGWSRLLAESELPTTIANLDTDLGAVFARLGMTLDEEGDTAAAQFVAAGTHEQAEMLLSPLIAQLQQLTGAGMLAEVRAAIVGMSTGTVDRTAALEAVSRAMGSTAFEAVTLVDTNVMAIDRQLSLQTAAAAGFEWFLFDGPEDQITRPWCDERVGKRFRRDQIDAEPNDTGPQPPSKYGGGYNCRHQWVPLGPDEFKEFPAWRG